LAFFGDVFLEGDLDAPLLVGDLRGEAEAPLFFDPFLDKIFSASAAVCSMVFALFIAAGDAVLPLFLLSDPVVVFLPGMFVIKQRDGIVLETCAQ